MKKLNALMLALLGAFTLNTATAAQPEPIVYMAAKPANPIVGQEVTWFAMVTRAGKCEYTWDGDPDQFPDLEEGPMSTTTNYFQPTVFNAPGDKYLQVEVSTAAGIKIIRGLVVPVKSGRLSKLTLSAKNKRMTPGATYHISWLTEGTVPTVDVVLRNNHTGEMYDLGTPGMTNESGLDFTVPSDLTPDKNWVITVNSHNDGLAYGARSDYFTVVAVHR